MKSGFTALCLVLSALIVCWAVACNATIVPTLGGGDMEDEAGQDGQPADGQPADDDERGPGQNGDQPGDGFETNGGFNGDNGFGTSGGFGGDDGFGTDGFGGGGAFDTNGG